MIHVCTVMIDNVPTYLENEKRVNQSKCICKVMYGGDNESEENVQFRWLVIKCSIMSVDESYEPK